MIAYFILVHKYPNQFKKLFLAIYHPDNYYLIHIDKKTEPQLYEETSLFLSEFDNVSFLESKITNWGGYSMVERELSGMKRLLELDKNWDFFVNLSGQDLPLKSQEYMHNYLKTHANHNFIKFAKQTEKRPETMNRIDNYFIEDNDSISSTIPKQKRTFLKNVTPYIGNQWMILSRACCEFITYSNEVKRFKKFYRNTLIADEGFFQTVIMNTSYKCKHLVNDDLRAIDWVESDTKVKLTPRYYTTHDLVPLLISPNLFARKFDEKIDSKIIDVLSIVNGN